MLDSALARIIQRGSRLDATSMVVFRQRRIAPARRLDASAQSAELHIGTNNSTRGRANAMKTDVIASEPKASVAIPVVHVRDCFVAALLAMTSYFVAAPGTVATSAAVSFASTTPFIRSAASAFAASVLGATTIFPLVMRMSPW